MIHLLQTEVASFNPTLRIILLVIFFAGIGIIVMSKFYKFFEQNYALKYRQPFFLNTIVFHKELSDKELNVLKNKFSFYSKLNSKAQRIFRHRVASFIKSKTFIGRDNLEVTDEMKILIAATAIMLTFGFRKYCIDLFDKIIIYPKSYYSKINETYHKGETNPQLQAIVFSWEDFKQGYELGDDNLNLGIHEFGHAIHLNALKGSDVSSIIINQGFEDLANYLKNNESVRQNLMTSKYFRAYAFTNQYEFFAVILENFMETPTAFKSQFPKLYKYMKRMLNFNFAGY